LLWVKGSHAYMPLFAQHPTKRRCQVVALDRCTTVFLFKSRPKTGYSERVFS
jgi:hypothetical protein